MSRCHKTNFERWNKALLLVKKVTWRGAESFSQSRSWPVFHHFIPKHFSNSTCFVLNGLFPAYFFFFRLFNTVESQQLFNIIFANEWIRTADLCFGSDRSANCATTTAQILSLVKFVTEEFNEHLVNLITMVVLHTFLWISFCSRQCVSEPEGRLWRGRSVFSCLLR